MNRNDARIIAGMKKQAGLRESLPSDARRLGWKSGFGTEGAMALIGVEQPLTGFLTSATRLGSGASVGIGEWTTPLLEAEVAVRIDSPVGPGASPEEGASAIGAVAAAVELVDLGAIDSVEEILGGNIFHRHVLLGEFRECGPDDLEQVRISVTVNGDESEPSDPREVIGDIGKVVAALADQADLIGDSFLPGDVIITGAAVPPAPVQPGDSYAVSINGGSTVAVDLV